MDWNRKVNEVTNLRKWPCRHRLPFRRFEIQVDPFSLVVHLRLPHSHFPWVSPHPDSCPWQLWSCSPCIGPLPLRGIFLISRKIPASKSAYLTIHPRRQTPLPGSHLVQSVAPTTPYSCSHPLHPRAPAPPPSSHTSTNGSDGPLPRGGCRSVQVPARERHVPLTPVPSSESCGRMFRPSPVGPKEVLTAHGSLGMRVRNSDTCAMLRRGGSRSKSIWSLWEIQTWVD